MRIATGTLLTLLVLLAGPLVAQNAEEIANRHLIIDTHIDTPYRLLLRGGDVSEGADSGQFDYPRAKAGGLDAAFMSIYTPATVDEAGEAVRHADELIDMVERIAAKSPEKFAIATCSEDLERIRTSGRIALPMGMENGGPIAGSFENLRHFWQRGIRYITLAHSRSNHISDSSYDENERWQGLSEFGKALVPEMNRQGVLIDVSHITDLAFWQVLERSEVPVIATHSSLRHFTPGFHRNMSDEMVRAMGAAGGVIQINFGSSFVTETARRYAASAREAALIFASENELEQDDPRMREFYNEYRAVNPYPYAEVGHVLDHMDRVVELAGIEAVGIGSDYDGVGDSLPIGLKDVASYPNLIAGLLRRGYSDSDIEKILGGNTMRVWRDAETYAARHGNPPICRVDES